MFNGVCIFSAYSFVCKILAVNYGILDVYSVTACVVKAAVCFLCEVVKILSCLI